MQIPSLTLTTARWKGRVISPKSGNYFVKLPKEALEHKHIVVADLFYKPEPCEIKNLAANFARLKTLKDIDEFASKYGMLGITNFPHSYSEAPLYGQSAYEPLTVWQYYIKDVRRLMRLYRALKGRKNGREIEIHAEQIDFGLGHVHSTNRAKKSVNVYWSPHDYDTYTAPAVEFVMPAESDLSEELAAAGLIAARLRNVLRDCVSLDFAQIKHTDKSATGCLLVEKLTTPYLLAAIYYDLWQLMSESKPIDICECCGLPIVGTHGRKFCSNACRQKTYRQRKKEA